MDSGSREEFGPYEVLECLGKGGMATVHKARKTGIEGFERIDALKRLLPHLEVDQQFVQSFVREAKLAARLSHGNIAQIHDLGKVDGRYYIAMEYLDGKSVQDILKQAYQVAGPPPLAVAMSIIGELLDALDYAHSNNVVHADVSPSNVIVSEAGNVKVIDFGIARASSSRLRKRGVFVAGKLGYMAPEVMNAEGIDARSDLFGVGVIAHELLTARPLFQPRQAEAVRQRLGSGLLRPSALHDAVPPQVDEIVMTALEPDPARRYASASDMRAAIDNALHSIGVASSRRVVAGWLRHAFQLDPRHGRQRLAQGSRRPAMPLPAAPELADDHDDVPALVTESADVSESVRIAREQQRDENVDPLLDAPTTRRSRKPTISSPPVDTGLVPKITFREPSNPGSNNEDR